MNQSIIFFLKYMITPLLFLILLNLLIYENNSILKVLIYLLIFSILTVLNLSKLFESNFFSYLTFLMMTGGILILFSFFLSLMSNTSNSSHYNPLTKILLLIYLLIMLASALMLSQKSMLLNFSFNNEYSMLTTQSLENYYFNINKMYMYPFNMLMCLLISYLLISLIFITKIAISTNAPMRKSN